MQNGEMRRCGGYDVIMLTKWSCSSETGVPLLAMPNVPRPLHGMAPRTILGSEKWNEMRLNAYLRAGYRCEICGKVFQKNESCRLPDHSVHELFSYDYENGIGKFIRCVSLCQDCHDFIHSGRMLTLYKERNAFYPRERVLKIIEDRFKMISEYNACHSDEIKLYFTFINYTKANNPRIDFSSNVRSFIEKYNIEFYKEPRHIPKIEDWKMVIDEREYPTIYGDYKDWLQGTQSYGDSDFIRQAAKNP